MDTIALYGEIVRRNNFENVTLQRVSGFHAIGHFCRTTGGQQDLLTLGKVYRKAMK